MGVLLKDRKDLGCLGFLDETHPHDGLGSQKQRSESGWFSEPSNDKFGDQTERDTFGGLREIKQGVEFTPRVIITSAMIVSTIARLDCQL